MNNPRHLEEEKKDVQNIQMDPVNNKFVMINTIFELTKLIINFYLFKKQRIGYFINTMK